MFQGSLIKKMVSCLSVIAMLVTMAGAASAETIIKYAHSNPATMRSQNHVFYLKFAELVKKYSDGKMTVEEYPSNQLGSEQTRVQKLRMQNRTITSVAVNNLAPFAPSAGVFTLPYLFMNQEEVLKLLNGPFADVVRKRVIKEAGVRILAYLTTDFRVLTNSKRPVCKLEDLQGLKIRVPKNPLMLEAFNSWGITPTPMAWSEVFTALQQGVIDGQENPHITNYSMNFQEVQKYITNLHYMHWIAPVMIGERYYNSLSPDMKKVIDSAAKDAALYEQKWARDYSEKALKSLLTKGMQICELQDEEEWKNKARSIWPKFYDKVGGQELVEQALIYIKK